MPFSSNEKAPCRGCPMHKQGVTKLKHFEQTGTKYNPKTTGSLIDECEGCKLRLDFIAAEEVLLTNPDGETIWSMTTREAEWAEGAC